MIKIKKAISLLLAVLMISSIFVINVSATENNIIKAGTYRFNDVLIPHDLVNGQKINFYVTYQLELDPENADMYDDLDIEVTDDGHIILHYLCGDTGLSPYNGTGSDGFTGWYAEEIQSITIPTDIEVDTDFYEWFTANAVEQKRISGAWKFNDVLSMPNAPNMELVTNGLNIAFGGVIYNSIIIGGSMDSGVALAYTYGDSPEYRDGNVLIAYATEELKTLYEQTFEITFVDGWQSEAYKTIDFGTEPQYVSADFYNWLTENATKQTNKNTTTNSTGSQGTDYVAGTNGLTNAGNDTTQNKVSGSQTIGTTVSKPLGTQEAVDVYVSKAATYTVLIPKTVILSGDNGIGEYKVSVTGDIEGLKQITVQPEEIVTLTQPGKDPITATIEQDVVAFATKMLEDADGHIVTTDGVITANNLTAGSWTGSFTMHISYDDYAEPVVNGSATFWAYNSDDGNYIEEVATLTWSDLQSAANGEKYYYHADRISNTKLDNGAFAGCAFLSDITIPNSITYIGSGVFEECWMITSIHYEGTIAQWNQIADENWVTPNDSVAKVICSDGEIDLN